MELATKKIKIRAGQNLDFFEKKIPKFWKFWKVLKIQKMPFEVNINTQEFQKNSKQI